MDSITILDINGKPFVSGLMWKPLRSVRNYMSEAKAIGKREGMDMVAVRGVERDMRRRSKVLQAGFAPKQPKSRGRRSQSSMRNMYSLAASLAGILGEEWIGAFDLGDGRFAFVAVHEGGIMPGRDLVGDRVEIESILRETYSDVSSTGVSPKIIAPAEWEFGGDPTTLESVLTPDVIKPDYRLKPLTLGLTRQELVMGSVLLSALVVGGLVGAHLWKKHRDRAAQIARIRSLEAIKSAKDQALAAASAALVHPWSVTPSAAAFIAACAETMEHVPLDIGGWVFDNGRCMLGKSGDRSQDGAVATYHRSDRTTVEAFESAAKSLGATPSIFDKGATGAVMLHLRIVPPSAGGSGSLPVIGDEMTALTTRVQSLPTDLANYTAAAVPWAPPKDNPQLPPPGWQTYTLEMQSALAPQYLLAQLDVPGLRLYEIAVSIHPDQAAEAWTLKGELYGK